MCMLGFVKSQWCLKGVLIALVKFKFPISSPTTTTTTTAELNAILAYMVITRILMNKNSPCIAYNFHFHAFHLCSIEFSTLNVRYRSEIRLCTICSWTHQTYMQNWVVENISTCKLNWLNYIFLQNMLHLHIAFESWKKKQ